MHFPGCCSVGTGCTVWQAACSKCLRACVYFNSIPFACTMTASATWCHDMAPDLPGTALRCSLKRLKSAFSWLFWTSRLSPTGAKGDCIGSVNSLHAHHGLLVALVCSADTLPAAHFGICWCQHSFKTCMRDPTAASRPLCCCSLLSCTSTSAGGSSALSGFFGASLA